MKITYLLSTRQRKALLLQGTPIRLILPVPPIEVDDLMEWARSVLPTDFRTLVTAAEEMEIQVAPRESGSRETLTDVLGGIPADDGVRRWLVTMVVIAVTIAPPRARHHAGAPQWPMDVEINGRKFLGK